MIVRAVAGTVGEYNVWGSIPQALYGKNVILPDRSQGYENRAEVGDTVTLTANVEKSSDDESFGFFSRPRKASVVERGTP